jgi:hypothetical protein
MEYGTYAEGRFQIDRALSPEHHSALEKLADEEHDDGTFATLQPSSSKRRQGLSLAPGDAKANVM